MTRKIVKTRWIPVLLGSVTICVLQGCETAGGNLLLSRMYGANASLASNPRQAAAWGLMSDAAAIAARQQAAAGK